MFSFNKFVKCHFFAKFATVEMIVNYVQMRQIHRYIILAIAICCISLFTSCARDYGKIKTEKELFVSVGEAAIIDTLILKSNEDISLHEYQGSLYKYIPEKDSVTIYEIRLDKTHQHQVIWYVKTTADSINVIDELSWDDRNVNY